MRIWNEFTIAVEIVRRFLRHGVEIYRLHRKHIIVERSLETPEGRQKLAEAMVEPMLSLSRPSE